MDSSWILLLEMDQARIDLRPSSCQQLLRGGKILGNHYNEHQLRDLPLDFKIGFQHPHPQYRKHGIIIVIGGGMPHWGEKFCNAFDNKSRDLLFLGKLMNLPSCVASRNTMQVNMFSFDSKVNAGQALVESANYFVPVKPAKKKRKLNKE